MNNKGGMGEFDIKSSTIDKSLDMAKEFLQRFVGPSVDEMGLLIWNICFLSEIL
jgi:hypothetical protein